MNRDKGGEVRGDKLLFVFLNIVSSQNSFFQAQTEQNTLQLCVHEIKVCICHASKCGMKYISQKHITHSTPPNIHTHCSKGVLCSNLVSKYILATLTHPLEHY